MTWLVTGAAGMLGTDLVAMAQERGVDVVALTHQHLDITNQAAVFHALEGLTSNDVVINVAAWTGVDAAEENEDRAFALNAVGPQHVAVATQRAGARLVHVSTDYVFGGNGTSPYPEESLLEPLGAYGRTKAAGEWAIRSTGVDYLVVRTAWLYGAHGPCFPKTMKRLLDQRGHVDVVTDQVGQPTWTVDLADLLIRMIHSHVPSGVYHGTSAGQCSWYQFTRDIAATLGYDPDQAVGPTTSEAFKAPAPRPAYSVLGHDAFKRVGVEPIGDWKDRWRTAAATVLAN